METLNHLCVFLVTTASIVLMLAVLHDAFEVMLLPRRVKSKTRIVRYFFQLTWGTWRALARRLREQGRHHFLGLYGPLSLVIMLIIWAAGLIVAFAGLYWADSGRITPGQFLREAYLSGATFFTLGYGDVTPQAHWSKILSVLRPGLDWVLLRW